MTLLKRSAGWHLSCYHRCDSYHLARARKRKSDQLSEHNDCSPVKTRTTVGNTDLHKVNVCFFCGEPAAKDGLCIAATPKLNSMVREAATELQDRALLVKLGVIELVAQDAQYHPKCLVGLYNRQRKFHESLSATNQESEWKALAMAELVSHIEEETRYSE